MNQRDVVKMIDAALRGLEVIQKLTNVGGVKAEGVVAAIRGVTKAISEGFDGKTSPEIVLAELEAFAASIANNDAAADAELANKFRGA